MLCDSNDWLGLKFGDVVLHAEGLKSFLIFLVAAGHHRAAVPSRAVGTVLGFLLVGVVLGPFGLGALGDTIRGSATSRSTIRERVVPLAELGIIFLLFLLGLELSLQRLWQLRRYVLGVGLVQVAASALAIGLDRRAGAASSPPAASCSGCASRCPRPRS